MASQQQPPQPPATYTNLQAAAEDGAVETRNPLAPPPPTGADEPRPTGAAEPLQPPIEPEDEESDGSKFRAVVAVVRCMVGPAALYIPKGFADAGLAGGLICVCLLYTSPSPRDA